MKPSKALLDKLGADLGDAGKKKLEEVLSDWASEAEGSDLDAVADYCRLFERKAAADAQVREHGALVKGPNGFPVENPWLAVSMKAGSEMRKIAKEIGR